MSGKTRAERRDETEASLCARIRLGTRIRKERQASGLTVARLASGISLSPSHLHEVEKGGWRPISEEKINEIADVLGVTRDELMFVAGKVPRQIRNWILADPANMAAVRTLMGGQ